MKLLNSLYSIKSKDSGNGIRYDIQLDASHFIYEAHFPNEPITPGVCIIQIAKELLEDHLGQNLNIKIVKNAKFLNVISPLEMPLVTYAFEKILIDNLDKTYKVQVLITSSDVSLAKLSFTCKNND